MRFFRIALVALSMFAGFGCSLSGVDEYAPLNQSSDYYQYIQPSYSDYLNETEQWLSVNRSYISTDHDKELAMNMPFEAGDKSKSDKAILLIHGLGDSPYSFSDLAHSLAAQGFYVQTLLLPGHGSKPEDLMLPSYEDWQIFVDHYANLLKQDFDTVWMGGFSTGANLATIHTIEQGNVDGLMLFSPGFQSQAPKLERLAPLVSVFVDGYEAQEKNLARYTSAPINGAIAYSDSAVKVRELIGENTISVPTLIAVSEADSVVDPFAIKQMFLENFNNPRNKLIWYGESEFDVDSIESLAMNLDAMRVSTGSHMSPLFAPSNQYYGVNGERKMCMNSFDEDANARCERGEEVWYSAWGYEEDNKIHARLTWNPYYSQLEAEMKNLAR